MGLVFREPRFLLNPRWLAQERGDWSESFNGFRAMAARALPPSAPPPRHRLLRQVGSLLKTILFFFFFTSRPHPKKPIRIPTTRISRNSWPRERERERERERAAQWCSRAEDRPRPQGEGVPHARRRGSSHGARLRTTTTSDHQRCWPPRGRRGGCRELPVRRLRRPLRTATMRGRHLDLDHRRHGGHAPAAAAARSPSRATPKRRQTFFKLSGSSRGRIRFEALYWGQWRSPRVFSSSTRTPLGEF